MVVLDTDLLVGLLRGNKDAAEEIKKLEESGFEICIASITSYELFKGAYLSSEQEKNISQVNSLLDSIKIIDFGLDSSKICAKINFYLKKKGAMAGFMDQMIASIVISKNEVLKTRNLKHYKEIPDLKVESW